MDPVRIKMNRRTGLPYAAMSADAPAVTLGDVKRILAGEFAPRRF